MVAVILLVVLCFVPVSAHATTYYVATTGSNSNDGLSEATPKLTIAHCVSIMVAGDTCLVRGGTYTNGDIRFGVTGTQAAPIKLLNYPGESPIISCSSPTVFMRVENLLGNNVAVGWLTIEGFEITNCYLGLKIYNLHDSIIRNNWIHHNPNGPGILGNGLRIRVEKNIINSNGKTIQSNHGIYGWGESWTIINNLFWDSWNRGIQINGSCSNHACYNPAVHAGVQFAAPSNWIIANNTFAYSLNREAIVSFGSEHKNTRIENNIFYENNVTSSTSSATAISFSASLPTGGFQIRNNHVYASGSGGQQFITGTATEGVHYTQSGNVVNVSPPLFVNGGSNALPVSPDFRLTARSPVNIPLSTEIPTNGVVGAFQPPSTPTATMTTNKIRVTLPMSAAVPVQNLSTAGVSFSCTSNVCPGSPVVSSVSRVTGTDSQVDITLAGITSNACLSHADPVTISYDSSTGTWTGNDNIGPYPGLHQKILSFTSVPVTNQCTGSGPPSASAAHITYAMENGSGTTVSDTSGNALHGTTSGTWVSGKTGFGINVANGTTQQITVPYGSGINPTTQSMTWVVPVFIPTGQTGVERYLFGPEIGTSQRGYIGSRSGTWRMARQGTSISAAGASNLAVVEGWNYLVARWDSATDTVTLCNNGVTGTGGATGSYTSYPFATNFEFPLIGTNLHTTVPEATFDDVQVFTTLEDCASLYAAWNAPPPPAAGTLAQSAIQFQGVILDQAGSPIVVGPSVQSIEVSAGGGTTILFQVHCTNVSDCALTAFKLVYAKNGTGVWQQVPDTETADGTWMWGVTTETNLNSGTRSTRLTGSCAVTAGATQVTSAQTPSIDLPQDGCVVLAYIVRINGVAGVDYFDFKLRTESNADFTTYDQTARVRVVNPMTSGIGF